MAKTVLDFIKGLSSDVVGFGVIFIAVAAFGLYKGKQSLVSVLVSIYLAFAAYTSLPFLQSLVLFKSSTTQIFFSKFLIFFVTLAVINFVIYRIIGISFTMSKVRNWLEIAALSVAITASLLVISFNALSLAAAYTPSLISVDLLSSGTGLFWTLVGSLVILFFAAR